MFIWVNLTLVFQTFSGAHKTQQVGLLVECFGLAVSFQSMLYVSDRERENFKMLTGDRLLFLSFLFLKWLDVPVPDISTIFNVKYKRDNLLNPSSHYLNIDTIDFSPYKQHLRGQLFIASFVLAGFYSSTHTETIQMLAFSIDLNNCADKELVSCVSWTTADELYSSGYVNWHLPGCFCLFLQPWYYHLTSLA